MAETLRIEIPIETVDETAAGLNSAIQGLKKLEQVYKNAGQSASHAGSTVTQFDRQAEKTERTLSSWAKEKYEILLEAKERITPILSTVGSGIKNIAGKTWSVTMKAVDLITSPVRGIINLLKNPVFQVGAVLGVSIGLKDTIDTYKNFEAAMSQVQAISGATGSQLEQLTAKAKEMGASTKFTATESAEAFNYMAMAGWKTEDMMNGIEGILNLAAASGEALGTTSDIVTDSLTAFGMKADEVGRFADVMAVASSNSNTNVSMMGETFKYAGAMAGTLKYSIEDVALATGLMANAGIKGNMAGTALNSIFTRLSTNTNGAADALKELGIAYFNTDGTARDFSDVMKELRDATANFTDEQKAQLGNTVAGTYAQKGFLAILNATTEDYEKLSEAVNNADGAAANMAEIMMDNLQGSIILFQSAADGVKLATGERLAPYIRGAADWLTEQMPEIEQALDELMDWVDRKVDRMQRKFNEIVSTEEWQDADFFGKVKIAWDAFIAEPFSEWWNGVGKAKFAGFAQDIGKGIGTGIKTGVMALFGIDISETIDEGASIGASFAKGFSEGFDFDLISRKLTEGLKNTVKNATKLLPGGESAGLYSVLSAVLLTKIASPFVRMGRGMFGMGRALFGAPAGGTSLVASLLGSTGNAMVGGSGLLGKFANVGYGLTGGGNTAGMYFGNTAGAMSGGTAALIGAGSTTGAIAAGATLVSGGIDVYKALKSEDNNEAAAYAESGAWKVGGVGAGAAAGAAIGSVIPGLGTAAGALIGAGIGGIAGWAQGNKAKEKYEQNLEEARKEAERAQKVFAATGLSIDEVTFANKDLQKAMNDSEVSAEQLALYIQEDMAKVAKEAFGDIKLSLTEIKSIAEDITFAGMKEGMEEFQKAADNTQGSLAAFKNSLSDMKKENWRLKFGAQLSESEQGNYKKSIDDFVSSAQEYIENSHYEATVALKLLAGGKNTDTTGLDSYYNNLSTQVKDLQGRLNDVIDAAMEDGVISTKSITLPDGTIQLSEADEIKNLQEQISEITNRLAEAQNEASMEALRIKYSGADLDYDSFTSMMEELKADTQEAADSYYDALKVGFANLNLQLSGGDMDETEYNQKRDELINNYNKQMAALSSRGETFGLNSIADAWSEQLDGILPDMEGTLSERLSKAMHYALVVNPDVETWTPEDVKKWFGLDSIEDTSALEDICKELIDTAEMVPKDAKKEILQEFRESIPTTNEIMEAIDWTSLSWDDYNLLVGGKVFYGDSSGYESLLTGAEADFEERCQRFAENIHEALKKMDPEEITSFMDTYMSEVTSGFDFDSVMEQYGPISTDCYETMVAEWQEAGTTWGNALNEGASSSLLSGSSILRDGMQTALDTATTSPFTVNPTVNVTPSYNITAPKFPVMGLGVGSNTASGNVGGHAAGGYVSGGPQLSWLAEEGYGEFIIPTNPSRRSRALDLYEQAGVALGVYAHADGGYVGGSIPGDMASGCHLFPDANRNAPLDYNETTEGNYDGETAKTYEPASIGVNGIAGDTTVQVNVNMSPEFVIQGGDGQSEERIMQVIRRHMKEMVDELGGELAGKLEEVFSNMPCLHVTFDTK